MKVKVQLLTWKAKSPTFAHDTDACADLYADEDTFVPAHGTMPIGTGIAIALEPGWEAQIRPRSGMARKYGITVLNTPGTIDADYRGEIQVLLYNTTDVDYAIARGDRIAQIAIRPVPSIEFELVDVLDTTDRGAGGFGSTGA